jgi:catechol 2,3-dioxygenase-like lactoylglutathione lyase family enzyme
MSILRVSHVGVCVSDMQRSVTFYRDRLGFALVSTLSVSGEPTATLLDLADVNLHAAYLERDGVCIELLCFEEPEASGASHDGPINRLGLTHLSLRVEDLPGTVDTLARAGVEVVEASRISNPQYGSHAVFVRDPDGTRIELYESPGDPSRPPGA